LLSEDPYRGFLSLVQLQVSIVVGAFYLSLKASVTALPKVLQADSGPTNWSLSPLFYQQSAVSFSAIPLHPATHIIFTLLCSFSVIRDCRVTQTNFELIWKRQVPVVQFDYPI